MPRLLYGFAAAIGTALVACSTDSPTASPTGPALSPDVTSLATQVRQLTAGRGITPLVRPAPTTTFQLVTAARTARA